MEGTEKGEKSQEREKEERVRKKRHREIGDLRKEINVRSKEREM